MENANINMDLYSSWATQLALRGDLVPAGLLLQAPVVMERMRVEIMALREQVAALKAQLEPPPRLESVP